MISWGKSYPEALQMARETGKLVLLDLTSPS